MAELIIDRDAWIRRFHPAPASAPRLVCFPHAGGSAPFYFRMSEALCRRAEILAVQYPGRQDRRAEQPICDIQTLADQIFLALQDWMGDRLIFFGHSMGAIAAFEVARKMQQAGEQPAALVVSGRRAPSRVREPQGIHLRSDEGVIAELKKLSGTDNSVLDDDEMLAMILPAVRSDYRAIETYTYQPGPVLSSPITAFVGDHDPQVTLDEARAWREHTTGEFELRIFSGGHFYLVSRQEEVISRISDMLHVYA